VQVTVSKSVDIISRNSNDYMAPKTIVVMILLITISVNYYFILPLMLMVCWAVNGNEDIWL